MRKTLSLGAILAAILLMALAVSTVYGGGQGKSGDPDASPEPLLDASVL